MSNQVLTFTHNDRYRCRPPELILGIRQHTSAGLMIDFCARSNTVPKLNDDLLLFTRQVLDLLEAALKLRSSPRLGACGGVWLGAVISVTGASKAFIIMFTLYIEAGGSIFS